MKTRFLIQLFSYVLGAAVLSQQAWCADLYAVSRLVETQSARERQAALRQGLAEVLVRVSGRAATLQNPEVRDALDRPAPLLLEYSYASTSESIEKPADDGGAVQSVPARELRMRFQKEAIHKLLRRAGEPILPPSRPAVLLWLAIDDDGRELLSMESGPELVAAVDAEAARRGIRLILPLRDLEETFLVGPDTVWNYNQEAIDEASARYGAHSVLVGRLFVSTTGTWLGDWRVELNGNGYSGDARSDSMRAVIGRMIDDIAETQSRHFAVFAREDEAQVHRLTIRRLGTFGDYVEAARYLDTLTAVRHANVSRLHGSVAEFLVYSDAGIDALRKEIALDGPLLPLSAEFGDDLEYRWRTGSVDP